MQKKRMKSAQNTENIRSKLLNIQKNLLKKCKNNTIIRIFKDNISNLKNKQRNNK